MLQTNHNHRRHKASSQSQDAVSSSATSSSQQSLSQPETTQQSAESSSTSAAPSVSEKNDHANLESRDQPVTISARDIQATRVSSKMLVLMIKNLPINKLKI